jgi:hypothetical protein
VQAWYLGSLKQRNRSYNACWDSARIDISESIKYIGVLVYLESDNLDELAIVQTAIKVAF